MAYRYKAMVVEQLVKHGIMPDGQTSPEEIREFINDLYLIEIRKLRKQLLDGKIRKADYAGQVLKLRQRYPILSLPLQFWLEKTEE
ncbi:MAG: hypothetical protein AB1757_22695 [Acidobacteriota bacterium]